MHLIAIILQMLHIGTFAIYLQLYVDTHTHTFIHTVYTYKGEKYNSLQMQSSCSSSVHIAFSRSSLLCVYLCGCGGVWYAHAHFIYSFTLQSERSSSFIVFHALCEWRACDCCAAILFFSVIFNLKGTDERMLWPYAIVSVTECVCVHVWVHVYTKYIHCNRWFSSRSMHTTFGWCECRNV